MAENVALRFCCRMLQTGGQTVCLRMKHRCYAVEYGTLE